MTKNVSKMCFIVNFKSLSDIHIFYGTIGFLIPEKHGYRHQNRDSSYARAQVMAKYVISMAAILNVL